MKTQASKAILEATRAMVRVEPKADLRLPGCPECGGGLRLVLSSQYYGNCKFHGRCVGESLQLECGQCQGTVHIHRPGCACEKPYVSVRPGSRYYGLR